MKYHKPMLHFITASKADAACVDGSVASPIIECTVGPGITGGKCKSGTIPGQRCKSGTAPTVCSKVGANVGDACIAGTIVTL